MKIYKIHQPSATAAALPPQGSDVYVGLDLHQKNWHVSIVWDGRVLFSGGIPSEWLVLKKLLDRYQGCTIHAVYEAGCFGYWLYDHLMSYGARCIVTPPSRIPIESGNRVKTDRLDSQKLAQYLSKGILKSVTVPTAEERAHRAVIRRRNQLVQDRIATQNRIKSELRQYNIPFPDIRGKWSKIFVERLHCLEFHNRWLRESFHTLLGLLDSLDRQIDRQTELIGELAKTDRYRDQVRLLRTIPGIGLLTAMEILVELQDIHRFPSAAQLAAYVGLTPSQHSSGPHIRLGRITRMGKGHLRALLVEASWMLIRKDAFMTRKYQALQGHGVGSKKAIIAIARKLLIRVRRVLLDRTPYVSGTAA